MRSTITLIALTALAASTLAQPLNNTLSARTSPLVPIGVSVWGISHMGCQADREGVPRKFPTGPTFAAMQYDVEYSRPSEFYSFALTRPLAEDEQLTLYAGDSFFGSMCAEKVGKVDWTLPGDMCQISGDANCVVLSKK